MFEAWKSTWFRIEIGQPHLRIRIVEQKRNTWMTIIIDDTNSLEVYELLTIATRVYLYWTIENHEDEQ